MFNYDLQLEVLNYDAESCLVIFCHDLLLETFNLSYPFSQLKAVDF